MAQRAGSVVTDMSGQTSAWHRSLIAVTTCQRVGLLRRSLPHLARFCVRDPRFALLVSLDGADPDTVEFCARWDVPLLYADEREGVGLSKNRVLERFPSFDYYFFLEDDAELMDGAVFPAHVELSRMTGIHHFSLFGRDGVRRPVGESTVGGHRVMHALYGAAAFNFYTAEGLNRVGGWHPRFASFRRWGHTEHSYRFARVGMAPAPFNVAVDLADTFIWHSPPAVTRLSGVPVDEDQIAAPERALMDRQLDHVALQTIAEYRVTDAALTPPAALAATLDRGERYPLVHSREHRGCVADYHLWCFQTARTRRERAAALCRTAWYGPANPALRHVVKTALKG